MGREGLVLFNNESAHLRSPACRLRGRPDPRGLRRLWSSRPSQLSVWRLHKNLRLVSRCSPETSSWTGRPGKKELPKHVQEATTVLLMPLFVLMENMRKMNISESCTSIHIGHLKKKKEKKKK